MTAAGILTHETAGVRAELARLDSKAGTLTGLDGAAAAFTATLTSGAHPAAVRVAAACAGLAFAAAVLVLLLAVLRPQLAGGVGFCRWATSTPAEIEDCARKSDRPEVFAGISASQAQAIARTESAGLLHVLSVIASRKFRRFRLAADVTAAGVVLLAAAVVAGVIA